ncbi:hypothetical protein K1719_003940 [Acacia pycnantha]|nr:hypothetical protein K1719_003940 [Acacia pycnantha]
MVETETAAPVSYRNKLLNMGSFTRNSRPRGEVVVSDKDYLIKRDGDVPSIEFSQEVRAALVKGMERTLLVDMEGSFYFATFDLEEDYTKDLTGGPWTIFGAYLTVQPWIVDFDPKTTAISTVVAWVRVPGLSFRYYHKSTLRAIGKLLGEVVKIDYMTENRGCGRYARIVVLTDLQQPLVPWIKVDGKTYGVEYEGLPLICFTYGKYGHTKEKCQARLRVSDTTIPDGQEAMVMASVHVQSDLISVRPATGEDPEHGSSPFGSWMQVRYPKKGNK